MESPLKSIFGTNNFENIRDTPSLIFDTSAINRSFNVTRMKRDSLVGSLDKAIKEKKLKK